MPTTLLEARSSVCFALQSEDEGEATGKDGADKGSGSALVIGSLSGIVAVGLSSAVIAVGLSRLVIAGLGGLIGGGGVAVAVGLGGVGAAASLGGGSGGGVIIAAAVIGGALAVLEEEVPNALGGAVDVGGDVLLSALTLVARGNAVGGVDGLRLVGAGDLFSLLVNQL